jgi:hypothetical protein
MKMRRLLLILLILSVSLPLFGIEKYVTIWWPRNAPYSISGPANVAYGSIVTYVAKDNRESTVTGTVAWTTSKTGVVIDSNGVFWAETPGIYTVSATKWNKSAELSVTVGPAPEPPLPGTNNPSNIVRDPSGNYYELDVGTGIVRKYDANGNYLGSIGAGQLTANVSHMAYYNGNLYISDGNVIKKFNAETGSFDQTIGLGNLTDAGAISFNSTGQMMVVDNATYPMSGIKIFDASTGSYQTSTPPALLVNPSGCACYGPLCFVADKDAKAIKVFDQNGNLVQIISQTMGGFTTPLAVAINGNYLGICDQIGASGRILIVDITNNYSFVTQAAYSGTRSVLSVTAQWQWIATDPASGAYDTFVWQP